ncbi:MAG: archease [Anaerolineales bacterium]|nr:archease [Anaerolineales bacterium]
MAQRSAGYREIEHTADWALQVWAPDLSELFRQAALGMYALSGIKLAPPAEQSRIIKLDAPDNESLLVAFLSELLLISEAERFGFSELSLDVQPGQVKAGLTGGEIIRQEKEIKAVTFHNLEIRQEGELFSAEIVFDV